MTISTMDAACQEKMVSFAYPVMTKNTFIDIDDDESNCGIDLGSRQRSAPARLIENPDIKIQETAKKIDPDMFEGATAAQDAPVDPQGPEPEPEVETLETQEQLPVAKWDRLATGERWANLAEAEDEEAEPKEPEAEGSEAGFAQLHAMPYGPYGSNLVMVPYAQDGCSVMALPRQGNVSQVRLPNVPATPNHSQVPQVAQPQKRRRRRAGASLIDIAKRRMQEETLVAQAAGLPQHTAPAPAASGLAKVCTTCDRKYAGIFNFCQNCGCKLQLSN